MRSRKRNNWKLILVVILLTISLGYAFLQTDLTINGTSKINATSWDIHFEDLTPNPNSVTLSTGDVAPTIDSTTRTDITYTITLKEPGDFYEFEVAIVNGGTLDAMIGTISNKLNNVEISTINPLPVYLSYSVTYSDNIPIAVNQLLEAGNSETIKVRLAFRTDIDPEDLPTEGATNTLSFGLSYVQADNNAVSVVNPISFSTDSWETVIAAIRRGQTSAYHVGDTKTVELGNSLGTHTIRIANTSTPAECSTTGFSQTACGFVLEFADVITTYNMNSTSTSVGGWPASEMRTYVNGTIYNALPSELKNGIINTTVVSGHGSTSGETNFTSTDKLYLLSTKEVWGKEGTSNVIDYDSAETETRQLDYYQAQGVTTANYSGAIKQYNSSNSNWWLRSAKSNNTNYFFTVYSLGAWNYYLANSTYGASPAFRIA